MADDEEEKITWEDVLFDFICPSLGVVIATALSTFPALDLLRALRVGNLGPLNPNPWAIMTGNCLGWCAYAFYTQDPFLLASSLPGLLVSFWLNMGAAKLQYVAALESGANAGETDASVGRRDGEERHNDHILRDSNNGPHHRNGAAHKSPRYLPQDTLFMAFLSAWTIILVCVGWVRPLLSQHATSIVGWLATANAILSYAAPLQTVTSVLSTGVSDSLHTPTVVLNCLSAILWFSYGLAKSDIVMYCNAIGFILGVPQVLMLVRYPKSDVLGSSISTKPRWTPSICSTRNDDDSTSPDGDL
jgi:solute carrier family 50 (sugar transporter)